MNSTQEVGGFRRIIDSPWFYYGLAGLLVVAAIATQLEIHFPSRPMGTSEEIAKLRERDDVNVIFILIDTLRSDRLSSYGYDRPTSPMLDALADSGIRFDRVEAQSTWTKASMASLWTGLYPMRTGVTRFRHALPQEAVLPAELLKQAGFHTAGIWRNGWVANNFGFDQGFDLYMRPHPSRSAHELERRSPSTHPLLGNDFDATESAIEFIHGHAQERFFLYMHYMDVHQYLYDQEAAKLEFGTSYSDAYDSSIYWVDRNIAKLVEDLQETDLLKRTLIVIAADHGESFYEHGEEGHAENLYREVTEVPLIFSLPFAFEQGVVVKPLVRNIDIWPTLLDMLGLPALPDIDGQSLVPLIEAAARGEAESDDVEEAPPSALSFLDGSWGTWGEHERPPEPLLSIRKGPMRMVFRMDDPKSGELFDHTSDPTEQKNLVALREEQAAGLRQESEQWVSKPIPWGDAPEVEIDEMHVNQLRALGYLRDE
ncbi:MAG: sulfatase [bacterium]|nr:sulfatase [bacterium]